MEGPYTHERRGAGFTGKGRGRGRGAGRPQQSEQPTCFGISADGAKFTFPKWQDTEKDSTLLTNFSTSVKCIGGYSEDEEKNFSNDKSYLSFLNMKYFPDQLSKIKKVNFDLTIGEEEATQYTGTPLKGFHNLLSWILSSEDYMNEMGLHKKVAGKGGNFVFMKNVISGIMGAYNSKHDYSFYATCVDGVIYLLGEKKNEKQYPAATEKQYLDADRIAIWGHKFEQLITISPHTEDGIISNWDYRCIISSKLGEHKLIYSAATDCVNPDKYDESMEDCSACVYLKCAYDNPKNKETKSIERYKMFQWCSELITTGTPEVVVGFRDENGMINSLRLYRKNDLIQNGKIYWDFAAVFVFLRELLSFVKERTEAKPGTVFRFVKEERCSCFTCSEDKVEDFLPDWFLESFRN